MSDGEVLQMLLTKPECLGKGGYAELKDLMSEEEYLSAREVP